MSKRPLVKLEPVTSDPTDVVDSARADNPEVGRWYWVDSRQAKWLGCVVHIGSNYVEFRGISEDATHYVKRVHFRDFWTTCEFVANPDAIIEREIRSAELRTHQLMTEVRALTAQLSITRGSIAEASETKALALRGDDQPIESYKKSLIKAKEKTLPELFKQIEASNKSMGAWMRAKLIPFKAQAQRLTTVIDAVKDRIFSVELYAGLVETIKQIKEGEPASIAEPIHLLQRRCYMDEECLAQYEVGGMEFKDIGAFDRWMAKPKNMTRILPFLRCVVAFRVRRHEKEREVFSFRELISVLNARDADKSTFLYFRNGDQLFRLETGIEFEEKLFPDLDRQKLDRGQLWAKFFGDRVDKLITDNEHQAMVEKENEYDREANKIKDDHERFLKFGHGWKESSNYEPFVQDSVRYDDIARFIESEIKKHNRLVLVLQGLLDRSPVFHPHPPWSLWSADGFRTGIRLIYDDSRTLVAGDKPDFEAYRKRLNASLAVGSITVGQEVEWEKQEAEKEYIRICNSAYGRPSEYRPTRYRPPGDPGPGTVARVVKVGTHAKFCRYQWEKERHQQRYPYDSDFVEAKVKVKTEHLLNVSAYQPGDFHQFFDDPRTRAEYMQWAYLLLIAEEYHAGLWEVGADRRKKVKGR